MMGKIAMGFKTMRFDGDGETFRRYKKLFWEILSEYV